MSPENQWLEDVFPIETVPFLGDMLVFRGVTISNLHLGHHLTGCARHLSQLQEGPTFFIAALVGEISPPTKWCLEGRGDEKIHNKCAEKLRFKGIMTSFEQII